MKESAGILVYKKSGSEIEFFLVHPGGPFFKNKENGVYSIPKGLVEGKDELLPTAIREFEEETGQPISGNFLPLGTIVQKGGKVVHAWAVEADVDAHNIISNTFPLEWPPKSGKIQHFPEVDRAGWFRYSEAKNLINEKQGEFLDRLIGLEKKA